MLYTISLLGIMRSDRYVDEVITWFLTPPKVGEPTELSSPLAGAMPIEGVRDF